MQSITHRPAAGTRYTALEAAVFHKPEDDLSPGAEGRVEYDGRRFVDLPPLGQDVHAVYRLTLPMPDTARPLEVDASQVRAAGLSCVGLLLGGSRGLLAPQPWLKMTMDVEGAQDEAASAAVILSKARDAAADNRNVAFCQHEASAAQWHVLVLRREFHAALRRGTPAGSRLFVTTSTTAAAPAVERGGAELYVGLPRVFEIADTAQLRAARGIWDQNASATRNPDRTRLEVHGVHARDAMVFHVAPTPLPELAARALERPLPPPGPVYVHLTPTDDHQETFLFTRDISPGALVCAMPVLLDVAVHTSVGDRTRVTRLRELLPCYANGEFHSAERLAEDVQAALRHRAPCAVTVSVVTSGDFSQLEVALADPAEPSARLVMVRGGAQILAVGRGRPAARLNVQALLRPGRFTLQGWTRLAPEDLNLNAWTAPLEPQGEGAAGGGGAWVGHGVILERLRQAVRASFPRATKVWVACARPPLPAAAPGAPPHTRLGGAGRAPLLAALLNSLPGRAHRGRLRARVERSRLAVECSGHAYAQAAIRQSAALMDVLDRHVEKSEVDQILRAESGGRAALDLHQRWLAAAPYHGALQSLRACLAPWPVDLEEIVDKKVAAQSLAPRLPPGGGAAARAEEARLLAMMGACAGPIMAQFEGAAAQAVVLFSFFQDVPNVVRATPGAALPMAGVVAASVRVRAPGPPGPAGALRRKLEAATPARADDWMLDPRHPLDTTLQDGQARLRVLLRPDPYLHQQIQAVTRHALDLIRG